MNAPRIFLIRVFILLWTGVAVVAAPPEIELVPADVRTRVAVGSALEFGVQATDPEEGELWLEAADRPGGATAPFVSGTGVVSTAFAWTPGEEQTEMYTVLFIASNVNGHAVLEVELQAVPLRTFINLRTVPETVNDLHEPLVLAEFAHGDVPIWAAAVGWRVAGGIWQFKPMEERETVNGVTTYEGALPSVEAGLQVDYYVFATDFDLQGYYSETNSYQVGISTLHVHPTGLEEWPYNTWERALRHPQNAMALAEDGHRILVADGEYRGQTIIVDREVTLESAQGLGGAVINGDHERQCLLLQADAVVRGLIFTEGFSPQDGGAVEMWAGRLEDSVVRNSQALGGGGGIRMHGGQVERVTVRDNLAHAEGGGVAVEGGRIQNALIHDNQASTSGGGIWAGNNAEIEFATVAYNEAYEGGGLYTSGDTTFLQHLIIVYNTAHHTGDNWKHENVAPMLYSVTSPAPDAQTTFDLDPLFANPGGRNFRLRSEYGRYVADGVWTNDAQTSPAIDMGNPSSAFDQEPAPNGGRVNIGAYGNTPFASKGTDEFRKLVVASIVDEIEPAPGLVTVPVGQVITSTIPSSVVTDGTTRYLSDGWSLCSVADLDGHSAGPGEEVALALTNNAILTWLWDSEHFVSVHIEGSGTVSHTEGWVAEHDTLIIEAEADTYFEWIGWINGGDINTNDVLELVVDRPYEFLARFLPLRTIQGTPLYWLADLGWTNNFEAAALDDPDEDGYLNWEEYIAGTDPLDPDSRLHIEVDRQADEAVLRWPVVSGRQYRLLLINDLQAGESTPLVEFNATQDMLFTLPLPTEDGNVGFFRLGVMFDDD